MYTPALLSGHSGQWAALIYNGVDYMNMLPYNNAQLDDIIATSQKVKSRRQ